MLTAIEKESGNKDSSLRKSWCITNGAATSSSPKVKEKGLRLALKLVSVVVLDLDLSMRAIDLDVKP